MLTDVRAPLTRVLCNGRWSDDSGRQASERDKVKLRLTGAGIGRIDAWNAEHTLTYGEILYPTFVACVLERVRALGGLEAGVARVFSDIGCGTAKPVFAAALVHPFNKCRGVEVGCALTRWHF
jgi:hypothetical protein